MVIKNALTYDEALEITSEKLLRINDLTNFCRKYELNMSTVSKIRNKKCNKPYPKTIARILKCLEFGDFSYTTCFFEKK
tara:strand:- start:232 stop:468 length:237 start_codon:yes stop_codon:yes gene_type:complete